jgi:hypothetical protein
MVLQQDGRVVDLQNQLAAVRDKEAVKRRGKR